MLIGLLERWSKQKQELKWLEVSKVGNSVGPKETISKVNAHITKIQKEFTVQNIKYFFIFSKCTVV